MDSKYTPISRRTISEKRIPELVRKVKETVLKKLETRSSVSLTTDLWSDRRLRSFLGVTAHVCSESKDFYAIESYLLECRRFTDTLLSEVENIIDSEGATDSGAMNVDSSSDSPPVKSPRLLSRYKAHKKRNSAQDSSVVTQISKYFDAINDSDTDNALFFWAKNHDRFQQLHKLALKVLSVPASSAPVERIFSRGGIIMRPHRACLGHRMLQTLIFLKCNQTLL
ncbi:hypothetical protein N1851_028592 [Merluccius polli]|uniref:HAT C-terminal dimerisation domain-containing protein n=1 Tax=Merluccius polli TaxID=89951 RepID=A0AA47NTD2_MERPO|nr:hypothetical protein N1851_028592 [Merluccius polli]